MHHSTGIGAAGALAAVGLVAGIWWTVSDSRRPDHQASAAAADSLEADPPAPDRRTALCEPVWQSCVAAAAGGDGAADAPPLPTSWQNPFAAEHWQAKGWTFDAAAMVSHADAPGVAIFRRPYRKVMVALLVEPASAGGPFEVRLTAPATRSLVTVAVEQGRLVVVSEGADRPRTTLRQRTLEPPAAPGRPGHLQLSATGNRLQVLWNGRRLLTCDQPAAQSGREVFVGLVAPASGVRVSNLRIEGE